MMGKGDFECGQFPDDPAKMVEDPFGRNEMRTYAWHIHQGTGNNAQHMVDYNKGSFTENVATTDELRNQESISNVFEIAS